MIPAKTAAGMEVLKDRSAADLTPRQRTALILIDGKRSLAEVLAAGARPEDIERLLELELIATPPSSGLITTHPHPGAAAAPR